MFLSDYFFYTLQNIAYISLKILSTQMEESAENDIQKTVQPLWVLPLYSLLSSEKQARVSIINFMKHIF